MTVTLPHMRVFALSNGRDLLAVDAGSNDVAAFRVDRRGVKLIGRVSSGGARPVSVDMTATAPTSSRPVTRRM